MWLTHSLHSAPGNSAIGNCGQPVPLAGVGMGGGSGFEPEKGDHEKDRRAGCLLPLDMARLKGACSWEPGLQPEDEASAE